MRLVALMNFENAAGERRADVHSLRVSEIRGLKNTTVMRPVGMRRLCDCDEFLNAPALSVHAAGR